jgi:hypothetical protein
MRSEPEAVDPAEVEFMADRKQLALRARIDDFKGATLAGIDQLADGVDHHTYRRLRNVKRSVQAL